ncbi:hypothetical protein [Acidicapsa acidisoli]|uniref:hypothetical protein n=1 Tax=Acidicapsa acidisoli TaxID=1615681 RepID=UPI0021E09EFD|nr:hypothetical protein [Acidicapsa acidisoli]
MKLRNFPAAVSLALFLMVSTCLQGQRVRTATLTETEIEQVRETAIFPNERVKLYTKFLDDRADHIKSLTGRPKSAQRVLKLDDLLQDFTALMDETGSNLDQYSDRHSDIRKALKTLTDDTPRWLNILRVLPGESGFDLARKEAIESGEELADQATRLLHEQNDYFAIHKDEKDQERNDDQVKPDAPKN